MKYKAIQSFVDSSFFTQLLDRKLNEYKLDSSDKPISAFMASPQSLTRFNETPILNLDYLSFLEQESLESNWSVQGVLHNVNTIEEFKLLDKLALLKQWGKELQDEIKQGRFTEKFHLLAFSDLKKYKFYYWLAVPELHSPWQVLKQESPDENVEMLVEDHLRSESSVPFLQVKDNELVSFQELTSDSTLFVFTDLCVNGDPLIQLKNYLFYLAARGFTEITIFVYRNNGSSVQLLMQLEPNFDPQQPAKVTGWERTAQGKLGPKLADLGSLIDPHQLANQAVDLNLKLMKWRVAPQLDLGTIKDQKCLLLGAGTLGSYVSRILLGWGVRKITFVDNGKVSYSNPVRQPLFTFQDCFSDNRQGAAKAERASQALAEIFPGVQAEGVSMEVPMIGHPVSDATEEAVKENFSKLELLIEQHDVVFLLMDSRESRWLPTVMGCSQNKIVINAALGFDGYLVMRHSPFDMENRLGCYFCNDVVAPQDSLTDRTLDQMCTVTRPGGAPIASALAVELLISMLQHQKKQFALAELALLGEVPHQIRGFLNSFTQTKITTPGYKHCSACSKVVVNKFRQEKWNFVKQCLNRTEYLEQVCGLQDVQAEADKFIEEMEELDDF